MVAPSCPKTQFILIFHACFVFAAAAVVNSSTQPCSLKGHIELIVQDISDFVNNSNASIAVAEAVASAAGHEVDTGKVDLEIVESVDSGRRLHGQGVGKGRRLHTANLVVAVSYSVQIIALYARSVALALKNLHLNELTNLIKQVLQRDFHVSSHEVRLQSFVTLGELGGSSELIIVAPDGLLEVHEAISARWNGWNPNTCNVHPVSKHLCLCPQPTGPSVAVLSGPLLKAVPKGKYSVPVAGEACSSGVPPAPPVRGAVLFAARGGCTFKEKVETAARAGYCALLLHNKKSGMPTPPYGQNELPDMTVEPSGSDAEVGIPAWLISRTAGNQILARSSEGVVQVKAVELAKRPPLGDRQIDDSGVRDHQIE